MLKVAIIGGTGYTGGELLRLLSQHPKVAVTSITSRQSPGEAVATRHPFLRDVCDQTLESLNPEKISKKAELVFVALSHTDALEPVSEFLAFGKKVIDLSADYRLLNETLYQEWYGEAHSHPELLTTRVYGLPELYRQDISKASLIANPGCYPTGAILPLYPFLKAGLLDTRREIIIDSKSGVSGAGRAPSSASHFTEVHEGMRAYKVGAHRHLPEIIQEVQAFGGSDAKILFTPHLLPVNRGILTTIYLPLKKRMKQDELESILSVYKDEPFIRLLEGSPNLSYVRGSNFCDIGVFETPSGRTAILISAIDNLVKGASGQAIQNMNLMMGWDETLGLRSPGFFP